MSMSDTNSSNEAIYTTRDESIDFVYSTEADVVGFAVLCIWAYLIPHLFIEYAEYRVALIHSPTWGRAPERLQAAKRALTRSFYVNFVLGVVLFVGSSAAINRLTYELDRRASEIVTGSSRLFAGVVFLLLSINIPQWMGAYWSVVDTYKTKVALFRSTREIRFSLSWSLWRQMATMFVFNLYFSCHTDDFTTLFGFLAGVPIGAFFLFMTYLARVKFRNKKRWFAGIIGFFLAFVSLTCVFVGALYIEDTWHEDYKNQTYSYGDVMWTAVISLVWLLAIIGFHVTAIVVTRKFMKDGEARTRYESTIFTTSIPGIKTSTGTPKTGSDQLSGSQQSKEDDANENDIGSHADENDSGDDEGDGEGDGDDATPEEAHPSSDPEDGMTNNPRGLCQSDESFQIPVLKTGKTTKDFFLDRNEQPSYRYLCRVKMFESCSFCCCFGSCPGCCRDIKEDSNLNKVHRLDPIDRLKQESWVWRSFDGLKMFLWFVISAFFLFLTIVNCGATSQQTVVRENLNAAFEFLYPVDYQTGAMCGWSEPNRNGDIQSFDSLEELQAANYTLIHCGHCGECSNWNDLSKQWTTRTFLAEATKKCAQKSLFGGVEDVQACNEAEPVGFTPACAECWTVDELCAKKNCFWIFLQSTMINAVSDYRVQINDITSATCDEAMCGPEFVPCSGATRRRMNIKSDIDRPLYQQCIHQDADWSVIFDHP